MLLCGQVSWCSSPPEGALSGRLLSLHGLSPRARVPKNRGLSVGTAPALCQGPGLGAGAPYVVLEEMNESRKNCCEQAGVCGAGLSGACLLLAGTVFTRQTLILEAAGAQEALAQRTCCSHKCCHPNLGAQEEEPRKEVVISQAGVCRHLPQRPSCLLRRQIRCPPPPIC